MQALKFFWGFNKSSLSHSFVIANLRPCLLTTVLHVTFAQRPCISESLLLGETEDEFYFQTQKALLYIFPKFCLKTEQFLLWFIPFLLSFIIDKKKSESCLTQIIKRPFYFPFYCWRQFWTFCQYINQVPVFHSLLAFPHSFVCFTKYSGGLSRFYSPLSHKDKFEAAPHL